MPIRISTWNINSIRPRIGQMLAFLRESAPDIVLLQETKVEDDSFPRMEIEDLGYNIAIHGQKTYNGVAIFSKFPLDNVTRGLPGNEGDEQARYIEAIANIPGGALGVASVYVPNGQEIGSEKFAYKLQFLETLRTHIASLLPLEEAMIFGGDYNVAPFPMDVYDPVRLDGTVCYHPDERARLRSILNLGMYDAFRALHPTTQQFSWWDYRGNSREANLGFRIDHLLLSPQAMDKAQSIEIEEKWRDEDKPSDHTPVTITLA